MMIEIIDVSKYYINNKKTEKVLDEINLRIERGDFIILMGKSGAGKTTLINCLTGLEDITKGEICIKYSDSKMSCKEFGKSYISQNSVMIEDFTGYENIILNIECKNKGEGKKINATIKKYVKVLECEKILNKKIKKLTKSERQLIMLIKVLIINPKIIIIDELVEELIKEKINKIIELLKYANKTYKSVVIIVTHQIDIACKGERIIFMNKGTVFHEIIKGNDSELNLKKNIEFILKIMRNDCG